MVCFFNNERYKLINSTFPTDVQKYLLPESGGRIEHTFIQGKPREIIFWSQAEKGIEK